MSAPPFVSYAQNAEDIVLWRALKGVLTGTYVDVGAADPVVDSVTKAFSDRGWSGVNVEPVAAYAEALQRDRPRDTTFAVAAGAVGAGERRLYLVPDTGLSTLVATEAAARQAEGYLVEPVVVPVRPLDELLAEAGLDDRSIHVCKVDVEGAEDEVFAGFDLRRWRPWVLVVEATQPQTGTPSERAWEAGVLDAGYQRCLFDGLNQFYVAPEHPELAEALSVPANVFDLPYVSYRELRDQERHDAQVEALAAEAQATAKRVGDLEAEVARSRATAEATAGDAIRWRRRYLDTLADAVALEGEAEVLREQLEATLQTFSWRLTGPLRRVRSSSGRVKGLVVRVETAAGRNTSTVRAVQWGQRHVPAVRRLRVKIRPELGAAPGAPARASAPEVARPALFVEAEAAPPERQLSPRTPARFSDPVADEALVSRVLSAATLLDGEQATADGVTTALDRLERALGRTTLPVPTATWLAMVAIDGAHPVEVDLDRETQRLLLDGPAALVDELYAAFRDAPATHARFGPLRVVDGGVVVDLTHTAAHDLHTGVQRVVRETIGRWLDDHELVLYAWDLERGAPLPLPPAEVERFQQWRTHMRAGHRGAMRHLVGEVNEVLVPWRSIVVLPELVVEPRRTDAYRAMMKAGVAAQVAMIGYDLIPITIAETVTPGMTANFGDYLSVVKYADRLSAISQSSAREFQGFTSMLGAQGLRGPKVVSQSLPTEAPEVTAEGLAAAREVLALDSQPLVLVVGSHEPRKNHVTVLVAAEQLWRSGAMFHLVFIGGSGWNSEGFETLVAELADRGRPVQVIKRAVEDTLWAAYRLARFTVFPSLTEGFGLPVAESLISGTPAIASNFGSLAEIATGGGCLTVDPRDANALEAAMRSLLDDDALLERLEAEAAERTWKTWDHYAKETWDELTAPR